jgi:hypothetical protein
MPSVSSAGVARPSSSTCGKAGEKKEGFVARLNRAVTEVGIEHFDDDLDRDARVKLPEWPLAHLKRRCEERKASRRPRPARPAEGEQ